MLLTPLPPVLFLLEEYIRSYHILHPLQVFAVDVDPDANLGLALGFSEEELESITPISKMRRLIEERTGADKSNTFYKVNPKVDDIPEIYRKENNGVRLLVLGTGPMSGFSTS